MKKIILIAAAAVLAASCTVSDKVSKVDPYIGTGGHGHVFLGANVPFGMVQLGPHQPHRGWDWCSGYHISDTLILGFSHTRLSGTGIGEDGDILMLPYNPDVELNLFNGHPYVLLDHSLEQAAPGYYRLEMPQTGITAELTAGERTGIQKYTVTADRTAIHLDLFTGVGWDAFTDGEYRIVDDNTITGFRRSSGWAKDHIIYFVSRFSLPIENAMQLAMTRERKVTAELLFDTSSKKELTVTTALSPDSIELAAENMESGDFESCRRNAGAKWNKALGKIEIEGLDEEQEKIFYTALYHTMFAPSRFDNASDESAEYTFLSLWDVYRAEFPLMTLIHPELSREIVSTFMKIYGRQGRLPVWHLNRNETDCMVGNPGSIILADLFLKGFVTDSTAAYEALKATSMAPGRGQELLIKYGFIPYDKSVELETASKCLEFAVADAGVAKVAAEMGDTEAAEYYLNRSKSYRKYYDPAVGFIHGRAANGKFLQPFDPFVAPHMKSEFTEGNAWQYTFSVPHDPYGLIEMLGGKDKFIEKIDEFFVAEGDLGGDANDITGLIGQYAHGNEPSHHVAYYYNYVDQSHKCAEKVRYILKEFYTTDYDGIIGNEDAGQMSAWYVLSSLGLYQVEPSGGDFVIGSPCVKKAVVDLGNGRKLRILAPDNSDENIYVASVKINGKPYDKMSIPYSEIIKGMTIEFEMTSKN